jgi:hypothetical protein
VFALPCLVKLKIIKGMAIKKLGEPKKALSFYSGGFG